MPGSATEGAPTSSVETPEEAVAFLRDLSNGLKGMGFPPLLTDDLDKIARQYEYLAWRMEQLEK